MKSRMPRFTRTIAATLAASAICGLTAGAAAATTHQPDAHPAAPVATTQPPGTLPTPPAGLLAENAKPGLLAADRLVVDAETGEMNGDEPVMLTIQLQSVLGQAGSTRVGLVNAAPAELGSGVDAGDEIGIPDAYGDSWFGVQPLTSEAVLDAVSEKRPVPIPVVVNATVMLEGDLSNGPLLGSMGQTVADHLRSAIAPELENTRITMDDAGNPSGYQDALARISAVAQPDSSTITKLVMQKIADWGTSYGDPDDPVGVSLTALVPVDSSVTELVDAFGGASALGLDNQFMKVDTVAVRTAPFDTDIQVRTGLLVPPSALNGTEQNWWTTYSGDYMGDDPASYRVWTHAWPQISW